MDIRRMAFDMKDKLVEMRRHLHTIPEIAFEEKKTSSYIADILSQIGIEVKTGMAKTGVVGILKGKGVKTFALRSDMDALPVSEKTGVEYTSTHKGTMHACGHDAHMSMLLGAAMILSEMKDEVQGNVRFIFQPSEESLPGGAKIMIKEGVLDSVDAIFGIHVDPTLETGKIGYKSGPFFAFTSEFTILLQGKGGHAAVPDLSIDPIVMASDVIQELQKIPSRWMSPLEPVIITIGSIHGGTNFNIIPESIELKGTLRLMNMNLVDEAVGKIEEILKGITGIYGGSYQFDFVKGYPVLLNDRTTTQFVSGIVKDFFGEKYAIKLEQPLMGGEDFAYYLDKVPGAFVRLGTGNREKKTTFPWHHPRFNIDEDALPYGTALYVKCSVEYLKNS